MQATYLHTHPHVGKQPNVGYALTCYMYHLVQRIIIGVAPITQYMHVRNKNSNTQGSSPIVANVILNTLRNCSGSKFFPLREFHIL